jgi:hypothetical protein
MTARSKPQGLYHDALLAPLGFLARIETVQPPFPVLLTERESMLHRAASRKACRTTSQGPVETPTQQIALTVFHGGKSLDSMRHWQPVSRTYNMALISAENPTSAGVLCFESSAKA